MVNQNNIGIGKGNAPNTLANLKPVYGSDQAREMQKKSVEARLKNKEKREAMALTAKQWKSLGKEVLDDLPPAIDILKLRMLEHMEAGELDEAAEIAKTLAEYEQPKLQRVDGTTGTFDANGMSDEELDAKLKELNEK